MGLSIVTQRSSYVSSVSSEGLTWIVYWQFGNTAFPDAQWDDFVLVLANWWIDEISGLETGASRCCLCFMDGPYEIKCRVDSEGVVCRAISDQKTRIVVTTWRTQVETLVQIVREYGRQVLQHCDQSGISGRDVDSLRMKLAR